jgi:hypothetical protein
MSDPVTPIHSKRAGDGDPKTPAKTPRRDGPGETPKTPRTELKAENKRALIAVSFDLLAASLPR